MTPEQELRTELAMAIIDATETDGNTDLTIDQITKLVDEIQSIYAPVLQREYDKGFANGESEGRQQERSR